MEMRRANLNQRKSQELHLNFRPPSDHHDSNHRVSTGPDKAIKARNIILSPKKSNQMTFELFKKQPTLDLEIKEENERKTEEKRLMPKREQRKPRGKSWLRIQRKAKKLVKKMNRSIAVSYPEFKEMNPLMKTVFFIEYPLVKLRDWTILPADDKRFNRLSGCLVFILGSLFLFFGSGFYKKDVLGFSASFLVFPFVAIGAILLFAFSRNGRYSKTKKPVLLFALVISVFWLYQSAKILMDFITVALSSFFHLFLPFYSLSFPRLLFSLGLACIFPFISILFLCKCFPLFPCLLPDLFISCFYDWSNFIVELV